MNHGCIQIANHSRVCEAHSVKILARLPIHHAPLSCAHLRVSGRLALPSPICVHTCTIVEVEG